MQQLQHWLFALLSVLLIAPVDSYARKEAQVWYFGDRAGLDFSSGTPVARTDGALTSMEGCASICTFSGRLLFYTNGSTIWNSAHSVMDNGLNLLGHESATQSAIILPPSGTRSHYYIFTIPQEGRAPGLRYHIVDMSANDGLGEVVNKNIPLVTPVAEKLTAVRHSDRRSYWIIVHGWNNGDFYAYHVGDTVSATPVVSSVGTVHSGAGELNALGAMKPSPDGTKLALALFDLGQFELFRFDASTGRVTSFPTPLVLQSPAFKGCYGVEFSPDGRLLYGSAGTSATVYQFDLASSDPAAIVANAIVVSSSNSPTPAGALQLGPDGRIYCARLGSRTLDVIADPNNIGLACDYRPAGVDLATGRSQLGLPSFVADFTTPRFTARNMCPGDSTRFTIVDTTGVVRVSWQFGDPITTSANTSTAWEPAHRYSAPGSYTVRLVLYYSQRLSDTVEQEVVIHEVPAVPLPDSMALCPDRPLELRAERSAYIAYEWSTGDTSPAITVTAPGTYWVRVSDAFCTIADTVVVFPAPAWTLAISRDTAICTGSAVQLYAGGAVSYRWTPVAGLDNPTDPAPLARPSTTTTYTVYATDRYNCTQERSVTVTVTPPPAVNLGADTTLCAGTVLHLDVEQPGTAYRWSTGTTGPMLDIAAPGRYWVEARRGDCTAADTITVAYRSVSPVIPMSDTTICRGGTIALHATGGVSHRWQSKHGPVDPGNPVPLVTPDQTTIYTVVATDEHGCTTTGTVTITVVPGPLLAVALPVLSAPVGSTVRIPVAVDASENMADLPLRIDIAFDAGSLLPTAVSTGILTDNTTGGNGLLSIGLPASALTGGRQVVTELTAEVLQGNTPTTRLTPTLTTDDPCIQTTGTEGLLLAERCGNVGTVGFGTATSIAAVQHSSGDYAELRWSSAVDGLCSIRVYSVAGHCVQQSTQTATAGIHTLHLTTGTLAPGLYHVVLFTGAGTASAPLWIHR